MRVEGTLVPQRLDLRNNSLCDVSFLRELTGLTSLDLRNNSLSDVSFLRELTGLTSLDLSSNRLSDVSFLRELTGITSLDLSFNSLSDVSFLRELTGLTSLDLRNNRLSDVSFLRELTGITSLDLSFNRLSDVSFLRELTGITSLDLRNNSLSDVSFLRELTGITSLDLSSNRLNYVSFLRELTGLTSLYLRNNSLSDVSFLRKLTGLTSLDLSFNRLSDVSFLRELTGITSLDLSSNRLSDVSFLRELTGITSLDLRNNSLSDVSFLRELTGLTSLDLSSNRLSDVSFLRELTGITSLDLRNNSLSDVSFLRELTGLTSLDLSSNRLSDVSFLRELTEVQTANFSENQIRDLPSWFFGKGIHVEIENEYLSDCLNITGNPIEKPPVDIIKQGNKAVARYFAQIVKHGGTEKLYESKILILGEPGSGKTTLFKKLQNPMASLPDTKSTLGVNVKEGMVFKHAENESIEITANVWDFGGQEIQYQLHQYFLSPDSLYILIADNRKQHTRWDYWFQIIHLLGGQCPVLVVLNNNQTYNNLPNFPIDKCKEHFSDMPIDSTDVDFNVNDSKWRVLQEKICDQLSHLPLVNKEVPKLWKPLRDALMKERKQHPYISIARFHELSPEGLEDEGDRLQALDYFHRIGIVLHFSEDDNLSDIVFLRPNWITQGLYSAMNGNNQDLANGCFSKKWIFSFWGTHENRYTLQDRTYLLRLMLKDNFDICYAIGTDKYIVPMLLPDKKPEYQWDRTENLGFRIQYPVMPAGIISRLIVRVHALIDTRLVWLDGVVLHEKRTKCRAQILRKTDRRTGLSYLEILVNGSTLNNRKELLSTIRSEIYHIHRSSFTTIPNSELIVCNCEKCAQMEEPQYYTREELSEYLQEGVHDIQCRKLKRNVSINELMGQVYSDREIRQIREERRPMDDRKREPVPESKQEQIKFKGTCAGLLVLIISFACIVGTAILLNYFGMDIYWFVLIMLFELLMVPSIWAYAVSPGEISEDAALKGFDTVLRRINLLKLFLPSKG